jgi:hypothetical protein
MLSYPSLLPSPLLSGYNLQQQPNLLRTEMDSGRSRQRRRFVNVPSQAALTFIFTETQASIFEGWIVHGLLGATAWFEIALKTPLGMKTCQSRFISNPLETSTVVGQHWQYQASVEILYRPTLTEEQTADAVLNPNTATDFVLGIKSALNKYQE